VPVSIAAPRGEQRITHRYRGNSLRSLANIVHAGGIVELRVVARVAGVHGNVAEAQMVFG
jgi:hypothetical protein